MWLEVYLPKINATCIVLDRLTQCQNPNVCNYLQPYDFEARFVEFSVPKHFRNQLPWLRALTQTQRSCWCVSLENYISRKFNANIYIYVICTNYSIHTFLRFWQRLCLSIDIYTVYTFWPFSLSRGYRSWYPSANSCPGERWGEETPHRWCHLPLWGCYQGWVHPGFQP